MNHSGPIVAQRDNLTVIDCQSCGYAHLDALPGPDELERFYTSEFWQSTKAGALADFERAAEWWAAIHEDWLSLVETHTRGRTLLDVGAGYGLFLKSANLRGWSSVGIEPNTEAAAYSRKHNPCKVLAQDWELAHDARFDCISAHWLIEHLPVPLDFLKWCRSKLNPDGVLLAAIPQEWTEAQADANEITPNKDWWLHHTHLNYFSQTTFSNLLGRAGFRIVDMLATYPMEMFISETLDYTVDPSIGRSLHESIERRELSLTREIRVVEYRQRARYGRGRDLIVVAKYE